MPGIIFDLTQPNRRPATVPMLLLVKRLMAATPGLSAPPTADFDDVSQWIDDVIGSDPVSPTLGQDQYLDAAWFADPAGSVVDTTQFDDPQIGC